MEVGGGGKLNVGHIYLLVSHPARGPLAGEMGLVRWAGLNGSTERQPGLEDTCPPVRTHKHNTLTGPGRGVAQSFGVAG